MKDKVVKIFKTLFPSQIIDSRLSKENCDEWDSINHLNLMFQLESEFNINIEPDDMMMISDIESTLELVQKKLNE